MRLGRKRTGQAYALGVDCEAAGVQAFPTSFLLVVRT
jgi:hypothetical protein